MTDTIAAAYIGTLAVIAAPLIALFVKRFLDTRMLLPISPDRRAALKGSWEGDVIQRDDNDNLAHQYHIALKLEMCSKTISGDGQYMLDGTVTGLVFSGGYHVDRYLYLNYRNKDARVLQHGLVMLELSPDAHRLEGQFLGYGVINQRLVSGQLRLTRKL